MDDLLWTCPSSTTTREITSALYLTSATEREISAQGWEERPAIRRAVGEAMPLPDYMLPDRWSWDAFADVLWSFLAQDWLFIVRDIAPENRANVARFCAAILTVQSQRAERGPSGSATLVLPGWEAPILTAQWYNNTSETYRVRPLPLPQKPQHPEL